MNYKLVYTQRAAKDIRKLDQKAKSRIGRALLRLETDPIRYAKRLTNFSLGAYRFRIGDYRAIFDLDGDAIIILRVGHRRDIYKG